MKSRVFAAFLGFIALVLLFLKLPGIPVMGGITGCQACSLSLPYLPLIGGAYFAFLTTVILSFSTFPSPSLAQGGLIWAVGLAAALTIRSPDWCLLCLFAHGCHVGMWTILYLNVAQQTRTPEEMIGLKLALAFLAPIATAALFSSMNFTFLAYGLEMQSNTNALIKKGDAVNPIELQTDRGKKVKVGSASGEGILLNFIIPACPFCQKQLPKLNDIAQQLARNGRIRIINVSRSLTGDIRDLGPDMEWAEDKEHKLSGHFGVTGFPTLVLVGFDGKVLQVISGLPSDFTAQLAAEVKRLNIDPKQ